MTDFNRQEREAREAALHDARIRLAVRYQVATLELRVYELIKERDEAHQALQRVRHVLGIEQEPKR